jgi:Tol biopolymer transport system component
MGFLGLHVALAPDERQVVIDQYDESEKPVQVALWLVNAVRGSPAKFTSEWSADWPAWSRDGSRIAFASFRQGPPNLYAKPARGVGPEKLLLKWPNSIWPTDWSPDGTHDRVRDD